MQLNGSLNVIFSKYMMCLTTLSWSSSVISQHLVAVSYDRTTTPSSHDHRRRLISVSYQYLFRIHISSIVLLPQESSITQNYCFFFAFSALSTQAVSSDRCRRTNERTFASPRYSHCRDARRKAKSVTSSEVTVYTVALTLALPVLRK